jgi:translocation and assembly module TamB
MRKYLIITVFAAPLPLLAQQATDDRGFLEGLLEDNLSGAGRNVDIQGFQGALSSTATIEALTIADENGIWLTLKGVTLNWSRSALLSGRLEVEELSAKELLLPRKPAPANDLPSAEASPLALPELPVSVNIAKLAIEKADLGADILGQAAVLNLTGSASLADGQGQAELNVSRLSPQKGSLVFAGSYANATRELALDLTLEEPENGLVAQMLNLPGQPPIALTISGNGPLENFTAELELQSNGQPRLTGALALITGDSGATQFTADLGGNIAPLFAPEYRPFFGDDMALAVAGIRDADGKLSLDRLNLRSDALNVNGRLSLDAQGWPALAQLRADLAPKQGESVILPLSGPVTRIGTAQVALNYDAGKGDRWTLDATLDGLERPDLALQTARLAGSGQLSRSGPQNGVDGFAELTIQGITPQDEALAKALGRDLRAALRFDWQPDAPLTLNGITLSGQNYTLTGDAKVSKVTENPDMRIDATAMLDTPDLSRFAALVGQPLAGGGALRLRGHVMPVSGQFDLFLSGDTQSLSLGQPMVDPLLTGKGRLSLQAMRNETGTAIRDLQVATDHAQIGGAVTLTTDTTKADITAALTDVQRIIPKLSGAAGLEAHVSRQSESWTMTAKATAPGNATAQVDATARGTDWNALSVTGKMHASAKMLSAYADLAGRPVGGSVDLTVLGSGQPAAQVFDADVALTGRDLAAGLDQVDQLLRGETTINAKVQRDAQGYFTLKNGYLRNPHLSATVTSRTTETIEFSSKLNDLAMLAPGLTGPASTSGTATLEGQNWRIKATGAGPGNTSLTANGTVSRSGETLNMDLSGTAPLALVNDLIRPRSLSGAVNYDLRINGKPALSSVTGRISTRDARLAIPDQRLALEEIGLDIGLNGEHAQINMNGRVSSGGTIQINGPVTLAAPFNAALDAQIQDVTLMDPKLFSTTVNGPLQVRGPLLGGAQVSGRMTLGQTELRVPNAAGTSYADLPGLQHVNEPSAVHQTRVNAGLVETASEQTSGGPAYGLDLQVLAPDRIFVRGRGLDAELGGTLRLLGDTRNVVPQGRFDLIRGRMDILGKRLNLDEGQIRLQGAFDPYIRFVASTQTNSATANIVIEGQASAPELTFASNPELPQDEVLALILFGKDISSISPLQAVRLAAAIRTLTGKGGDGLGGNIRKGLALDDLDVTTTDDGATEARAGKYLSENIYSEVTADTEGKTQINLNLTINRSVTARGRLSSDGDTGIGIFIEKDY